ncbi:MAG: Crp/Fnr family transcriptional regulator [Bacteroidales bacterium]
MNETGPLNSCTIGKDQYHCFDKLNPEELDLYNSNQMEVHFKKGEMILKQGTYVSNVMFLVSGLVKIFVQGPQGNLILKIIAPGNLIAVSSAMEGNQVYQYSAQAYVDSVVKAIDIKVFRQLMMQNAHFAAEIVNILSMNSIQIYSRFYSLQKRQSFGKLADVLLCLSEHVFRNPKFELDLTRKEIGEMSEMASENVIRILKSFSEDGLIKIEGKTFEILDAGRLREISNTG